MKLISPGGTTRRSATITRRPARYIAAQRSPGLGTRLLRLLRTLFLMGVLALAALLLFVWWVDRAAESMIFSYDAAQLPQRHVAMVFGAGLNRDGAPSKILYDRVATAADLYHSGKVARLLMTGDNSEQDYNEVEAMRRTAVELGVPDAAIVLDYAGFSTYESCYRARDVFGVHAATLVTNRYHLPRALHLCAAMGLDVVGVPSDRQTYATSYYSLREIPALLASQLWLIIDRKPTFLGDPVNVDLPQRTPTTTP